jgi:hypothetical protein
MEWKSIFMMAVNKGCAIIATALMAAGLIPADGSQNTAVVGALILAVNILFEVWAKWGMVLISGKLARVKGIPLPGEPPDNKMRYGGSDVEVKSRLSF